MLTASPHRALFNGAVADSSYPFEPDRFDEEADAVSFHGAHRAEEPFWRQNLIYIVIIAAAFITLLVLLFLIGGMGKGGDGDDRAADPTGEQSQSASPEPSEEEPTDEAPAEPDRSVQVEVINAAGINKLAGDWRDALKESGWQDVTVSTADNRQEQAVVYYRDEADKATAQALADEVGAGEAVQSDEYDSPITFLAVQRPGEQGDGGDNGGENGGDNGEGQDG